MSEALVSVGAGGAVVLAGVRGRTRRVVALLLEAQVHVPSTVNVLHLLGVQLVLLDVVSVIVERVPDTIDLALYLLFNLGLAVDLPNLAKL